MRGAIAMLPLVLWILPSCRHDHKEQGDHAHSSGGLPAIAVTRWTSRTELFLEHEPFVQGREGKLAAHLTVLETFKPVTEGSMTLVLRLTDGTRLTARAERAASPGIFRASIRPTSVGACRLSISVDGPQVSDEIDAGPCQVYRDPRAAAADRAAERGQRIAFTKEQQWKTDFATVAVAEHALQGSMQASAEVRPVAGKEVRLTAPVTGVMSLTDPPMIIGMPVKAGQVLALVSPRLSANGDRASLEADVQAARAELTAAEAQLGRAERLFKEQAVAERSVEDARARVGVTRARLGAAQGRLVQYSVGAAGRRAGGRNAFQVRSPIDGTIVAAAVASGERAEEGKLLFTVIDLARVWLEARVYEPDIPRVEGSRAAWFTIEGEETPFVVEEPGGRLVTIGRVIHPRNRTVPVIFEVANPGGRLRIGSHARVSIATGAPRRGLAVPDAAVLEDRGQQVVYVQVEGEAFERRALTIGVRSRGLTGVREGLTAGDRVVTRGAYQIKLAAASGAIPQHGHVH